MVGVRNLLHNGGYVTLVVLNHGPRLWNGLTA